MTLARDRGSVTAMRLLPCSSCERHVRILDVTCPFCGAELGTRAAPPLPNTSRMSRGARLALGAAIAIAGCGGSGQSTEPPPQPTAPAEPTAEPPDDGGDVVAEYGAPAPPPEAQPSAEPEQDQGGMAPKYGAPPPPKN